MNHLKLVFIVVTSVAIVVASSFAIISLRPAASVPPPSSWTYTANWGCNGAFSGWNPSNAEMIGQVSGEYQVRISVRNPSTTSNLTVKGEFVESLQQGPQKDVIPKWTNAIMTWTIEPDASLYIDCNTLSSLLHWSANNPFQVQTGFATLTANTPSLNVVATYTAESFNVTSGGLVPTGISIQVQNIPAIPPA